MDKDQANRLREQVQLGDEAEVALRFFKGILDDMRRDIHSAMENEDIPDSSAVLLRHELKNLRCLESKIEATIRSGQAAMRELNK